MTNSKVLGLELIIPGETLRFVKRYTNLYKLAYSFIKEAINTNWILWSYFLPMDYLVNSDYVSV